MASTDLSKIHVTNTTGLSLNDRFTAIATTSRVSRSRSRSQSRNRARSLQRELPPINPATSLANARLLKKLARKHTVQAALKLKRRSMRNATTAGIAKRRRGNLLRRNGLTNVGTMRADMVAARRPLRRSNSLTNINGRSGGRRPLVGGAAERFARRQAERLRAQQSGGVPRGRSRSRSRGRAPNIVQRGRSRSRARMPAANAPVGNVRRARSNSRNLARFNPRNGGGRLSIKDRLGVRQGANNMNRGARERRNSISNRGITNGRIEKRRNNGINSTYGTVTGRRMGRERARLAVRNVGNRSRSRTRRGQIGAAGLNGQQQQNQQQRSGNKNNTYNIMERSRRRSRSRQNTNGRLNNGNTQRNTQRNIQRNAQRNTQRNAQQNTQRNGNQNGGNNNRGRNPQRQQKQQQQRRSRSRSRNNSGGAGVARNQAKNAKPQVSKDALDKELDQYMATTKTENNMDYLLNN